MERAEALTRNETAALHCYLAVNELAAFALQGEWLPTASLVESARIWLAKNTLTASWLDRVTIARRAHRIARDLITLESASNAPTQPERLFTDAMSVNYADAVVAKVWLRCLEATQT
jgi:hypothetical protein